jgi:purine-binding chemotaxis protein CheW
MSEPTFGEIELDAAPAEPARPFRERLGAGDEEVQVISFRLGAELYACDILLVQEIVTKRRIHRLPDMPPRLLGMLRLRGELVPVIDLAPLFEQALDPERHPAVLVVDAEAGLIGVAADQVHEVAAVPAADVRPAPLSGRDRDAFVAGVARVDGRLVTLIDLAEILRDQTTRA